MMKRGLFFSFFVGTASAMAVIAVLCFWLVPHGGAIAVALIATIVIAGAAWNAQWMVRSVHRDIATIENAVRSIPESTDSTSGSYRDFNDLHRMVSAKSELVRRTLAEAGESRSELEAMIDSMQDAVVAVDQSGRIRWSNRCMQRLIPEASSRGAVRVGHALVQTIRDPDVLHCVKIALEERTIAERRSTSLTPGRIFEVSASPMPDGGAVAVLHDITRIEQVERIQRDFVANVSHEMRTPLTSITGYVETLLDHEKRLSAQAREFLGTILKNATRMNRLTEDLLAMARAESAEQEMHPVLIRADVLVREAVQSMRGMVQDADAVLEIEETTEAEVIADTDAIVQVLNHLIENGIKYGMARNAERGRVVVSAREVTEPRVGIEFRVRDYGQGIASEHLSRIFERFYRVDKARSRESGGTGLGLAIAHRVVEAHGGVIWAESELNAGTTFIVVLPKAGMKQ
ncbi:MAG TPA: ATP-binding protein [Edaphobacter sp.]|nr:ATP-binding protein [Edaphobacter sp.]